jgi:N-acetyltransferase 10
VNRDALFSYHKLSEAFLQKLMGLYTSAHYKNTPNDLQMLSDAPAHSVFVLLSPSAEQDSDSLPDVLAVIQVALEGSISRKTVEAQLARGHRSAGDLIPWTISQQFGDSKFAQLSGARIVRVAVHPSVQGMGYGSRAIECLYRFYNGEMVSLVADGDDSDESIKDASADEDSGGEEPKGKGILGEDLKPRKELPPLLLPLTEVDAPKLDWIGTSFGLTLSLQKFWTRAGLRLLYLRQTKNELTGEYSAIMLRSLPRRSGVSDVWLPSFMHDARRRVISLLSGAFRGIDLRLALSLLESFDAEDTKKETRATAKKEAKLTAEELDVFLSPHDLKRLELYGRNLCDHHLVTDLLSTIARLNFSGRLGPEFHLSSVQAALLCGIGLQHRTVDQLTSDLKLPGNQVLAMFNKAVRKVSLALNAIVEQKEKESLLGGEKREAAEAAVNRMRHVAEKTLDEDAQDAANEAMKTLTENEVSLPPDVAQDEELMQYVVKGSNEQWSKVLEAKNVEGGVATVRIQSFRDKLSDDTADQDKKRKQDGRPSENGKRKGKKSKRKSHK